MDADEEARFEDLLARRALGEPVAYLAGEREFYGRPFAVDRRVLIPRPETEHLVEEALALELPASPRLLDVGTGSGCLAVTLALEIPGARVTATDLSLGALAVARHNAHHHGVASRVALAAQDLASALDLRTFDLVVSNPPYVDRDDAAAFSPEVRDFEPHLALFAPDGGLATLTRLFEASAALRPGTPVLVEIGYGQSTAATERAVAAGLVPVKVRSDYAAIPRTLVFRRGVSI